jgi:hypothetical protein
MMVVEVNVGGYIVGQLQKQEQEETSECGCAD